MSVRRRFRPPSHQHIFFSIGIFFPAGFFGAFFVVPLPAMTASPPFVLCSQLAIRRDEPINRWLSLTPRRPGIARLWYPCVAFVIDGRQTNAVLVLLALRVNFGFLLYWSLSHAPNLF